MCASTTPERAGSGVKLALNSRAMQRLIALPAVLLTLGFAACGGGDDTSSTASGASGTSGAQGAAGGSEMTASEFIDASIPDEIDAVKQAAESNPNCAD